MSNKIIQEPNVDYILRLAENITRPLEVLFFLLPGFPIYSVIPAVECLRVANQNTNENLFRWKLTGSGAPMVRAGADMTLSTDGNIEDQEIPDMVIIFAGNEPIQGHKSEVWSWLKTANRAGCFIVGVDTAVFTMAAAGVLNDHIVTLHWEVIPLFREYYPDIQITEKLYHADGNIITCAGGMAVLDMMLEIIRIRYGDTLAHVVADGFVYSRWRPGNNSQRPRENVTSSKSTPETSGNAISSILRIMEENLTFPLTPVELADRFNMSRRTLERHFQKHIGDSVGCYYMRLRIDMAIDFLFYSNMDVTSVAMACGFSSNSYFTRVFQKAIGITPTEFVRLKRSDRINPYRPRSRYHLDSKSPIKGDTSNGANHQEVHSGDNETRKK